MVGDLLAGWAPSAGAVGLLLLAVSFVLTGRIWPASTVRTLIADKDAQIADLKAANSALAATVGLQAGQVGELMEISRTSAKLLQGIADASARSGR